ncbi:MAG: IscA/HesB family protein [Thermodesulfobacteriota bacterium]
MIEVTAVAERKLKQYLTDNNLDSAVRVIAMSGCGGPSLGLSLDEAKDSDAVVEKDSLRLLVSRELVDLCGRITVDYVEPTRSGCGCGSGGGSGFSISSERPLPGGGGSCAGSCSSGSCGC